MMKWVQLLRWENIFSSEAINKVLKSFSRVNACYSASRLWTVYCGPRLLIEWVKAPNPGPYNLDTSHSPWNWNALALQVSNVFKKIFTFYGKNQHPLLLHI